MDEVSPSAGSCPALPVCGVLHAGGFATRPSPLSHLHDARSRRTLHRGHGGPCIPVAVHKRPTVDTGRRPLGDLLPRSRRAMRCAGGVRPCGPTRAGSCVVIYLFATSYWWLPGISRQDTSKLRATVFRSTSRACRTRWRNGSERKLTTAEHRADLLRYLAHEAAHFWWTLAPADTWEDWLNESFAEYSALLLIRDRFGEEEFRTRMDRKRESAEGTPPIWGFDRGDTSTEEKSMQVQAVLYNAGPQPTSPASKAASPAASSPPDP